MTDVETAELRALLRRIAPAAVRYDARVYRLTDDFNALTPFLSEEDIEAAGERPSETDARVERERDDLQVEVDHLNAVIAKIRSHSKPVRMITDSALSNQTVGEW